MISVCIPTYKHAHCIRDTIRDVLNQTYQDFEIIVSDDNSGDDIRGVVEGFNDKRIRFFANYDERLNCGANQEKCRKLAKGEIIMLLSGKTRISRGYLQRVHDAFLNPDVGAVTRHYYWFGKDLRHVVRVKDTNHLHHDTTVEISSVSSYIKAVLSTVDNPGGIAYRRDFLTFPFSDIPFVEFTYPFLHILKHHKVVLLKGYHMAVPAFQHSHSQDAEVYNTSPLKNWIDMFKEILTGREQLAKYLTDEWAKNYIGLVQVRNYATWGQYFREVKYYIKYRKVNLGNPIFWFYVLGTMFAPKCILRWLVREFKESRNLDARLVDTTRV